MSTPDEPSALLVAQLDDKEIRDEFVADQVRVYIALSIRALREQRGMSQAEFGALIGKPQSVISRLEDPDYENASVRTLLEIAAGFDVPLLVSFPQWGDWLHATRKLRSEDLRRMSFADALSPPPVAEG